jgi:hypothetical protein
MARYGVSRTLAAHRGGTYCRSTVSDSSPHVHHHQSPHGPLPHGMLGRKRPGARMLPVRRRRDERELSPSDPGILQSAVVVGTESGALMGRQIGAPSIGLLDLSPRNSSGVTRYRAARFIKPGQALMTYSILLRLDIPAGVVRVQRLFNTANEERACAAEQGTS